MNSLPLAQHFIQVSREIPDLVRGAIPMAMGDYAVVIDHGTTVSKIYFGGEYSPTTSEKSQDLMKNEIRMLQLLQGETIDTVQVPQLVEAPAFLDEDEPHYVGHFRMTKLTGHEVEWRQLTNGDIERKRDYCQQVGKLMAQVHRLTQKFKDEALPEIATDELILSPDFNTETAALVESANRYIKAHKKEAVVHGDVNFSNMLVNEQGQIESLLDWSFGGKSDNHLSEFKWAIKRCPEAVADMVAGYEQESGQKVDQSLIYLMSFRGCMQSMINTMRYCNSGTKKQQAAYVNERIQEALRPLQHMHLQN